MVDRTILADYWPLTTDFWFYYPTYQGLIDLSVTPHYLTDEVMENMFNVVEQYKDNIRTDVIFKGIKW